MGFRVEGENFGIKPKVQGLAVSRHPSRIQKCPDTPGSTTDCRVACRAYGLRYSLLLLALQHCKLKPYLATRSLG